MYAVVGCTDCEALWLVADPGDAETATCPRCGRTHRTDRLRRLFESEDRATASEARATMLARRRGDGEAFEAVPSGRDLERAAEAAGIDDREYLDRSGVDPEAVAAAGEGDRSGDATDRAGIVREAVETLDAPTEADVVAYATDRGVPAEAARDLLSRLVRRGEAVETGGTYRPV
ncbi:MAG: DUF5817 domain-containing protein [Haloferacaceae archaeon]